MRPAGVGRRFNGLEACEAQRASGASLVLNSDGETDGRRVRRLGTAEEEAAPQYRMEDST